MNVAARKSVARRPDHTASLFWKRTVSAQIHALGCLAILVEAFFLLPAARDAGMPHFWACLVYLVTGAFVFALSSTYHFMHDGFAISSRLEESLENLDHFGIYLFIAGTYSPALLNTVAKRWQATFLFVIWTIAFLGISYTILKPRLPRLLRHRFVYTSLFLAMGWFMLLRVREVFSALTGTQIFFFVGGVVAYCLGAVVYALKWPRLFTYFGYHELWHVMVVAGAQLHYVLILSFYR